MRDLKTRDIFPLARLLNKLQFAEFLKGDIETDDPEELTSSLGKKMVDAVISNLGNAEKEASEFFAGVCGITPAEWLDQPFAETVNQVKELFSKAGFMDFFSQAASTQPKSGTLSITDTDQAPNQS